MKRGGIIHICIAIQVTAFLILGCGPSSLKRKETIVSKALTASDDKIRVSINRLQRDGDTCFLGLSCEILESIIRDLGRADKFENTHDLIQGAMLYLMLTSGDKLYPALASLVPEYGVRQHCYSGDAKFYIMPESEIDGLLVDQLYLISGNLSIDMPHPLPIEDSLEIQVPYGKVRIEEKNSEKGDRYILEISFTPSVEGISAEGYSLVLVDGNGKIYAGDKEDKGKGVERFCFRVSDVNGLKLVLQGLMYSIKSNIKFTF